MFAIICHDVLRNLHSMCFSANRHCLTVLFSRNLFSKDGAFACLVIIEVAIIKLCHENLVSTGINLQLPEFYNLSNSLFKGSALLLLHCEGMGFY